MNGRERILAAIRGDETDSLPHDPISMMIAADEIGVPYKEYATDYRQMVRGQIAFAERYDVDHVSGISDPAVEAADCGASVIYHPDQPPAIDEENAVFRDKAILAKTAVPTPEKGRRMSNRVAAVARLAEEVGGERLVEGWIEGPVAESSDLRGINRIMMDFYDDPRFVRDLFDFVFELEIRFARAQVEAGAEIIGMGDAASSLVGPQIYEEFVFENHRKFFDSIHALGVPVRLHICGNITGILPWIGKLPIDLLDVDSMVPMDEVRAAVGPEMLVSGNIDPVRILRNGSPETVTNELAACRDAVGGRRYAVAAGCEIPRDTPPANLEAMRKFARSNP